jgi:hypothetical protein
MQFLSDNLSHKLKQPQRIWGCLPKGRVSVINYSQFHVDVWESGGTVQLIFIPGLNRGELSASSPGSFEQSWAKHGGEEKNPYPPPPPAPDSASGSPAYKWPLHWPSYPA